MKTIMTALIAALPCAGLAQTEWHGTVGAGVRYAPEYEGADRMESDPFPFVALNFGRASISADGVGIEAWRSGRTALRLSLGHGGGRDADDSDRLAGLPEIDDGPVLRARLSHGAGLSTFYAELEKYTDATEGTSLELGMQRRMPVSRRLVVTSTLSATLSDDDYMGGYFGIDPAASSGLAPYDAEAGLRRIDIALAASYALTPRWLLRGEIGAGMLQGDAADSPLVEDDVQPNAALLLAWRF